MDCRVVKVGGSLFASTDDVGTSVGEWLREQTPKRTVIVTGGGIWADQIRRLDAESCISMSAAHDLAIRSMSLTSLLLAQLLPDTRWIAKFAELRTWLTTTEQPTIVYDAAQFMREIEPNTDGIRLPRGWDVTSDSIAARLAQVLRADELVLLKSIDDTIDDPIAAVERGTVDRFFPRIASALVANAVTIRSAKPRRNSTSIERRSRLTDGRSG